MVASVVIDRQHLRQTAPFASLHSSRLFPLPYLSPSLPIPYGHSYTTAAPQPLCNQLVTHSFYLDGGCTPPLALPQDRDLLDCPSPTPYPLSQCSTNSFRIHTYKNRHFARFSCHLNPFRINTSKSVSKQMTLTAFRMNTYEKQGEGGPVIVN